MSDQPLFNDMDKKEAASGQQPTGSDTDDTADDVGVPAAGAGLLGQTGGGASTGVVGGGPSAVGPVVGAAEPEDETSGDRPV